jgi:hypothetical protein
MSIFGISSFSIVSLTFSLDYSSFMDHGPVPFSLKPCNNLRAAALWPVARPLAALPHIFAVACTVTVSCRKAPRCSAACNVYYVCVCIESTTKPHRNGWLVGSSARCDGGPGEADGLKPKSDREESDGREHHQQSDVRRGTGTTGGEREARRRGGCGLHRPGQQYIQPAHACHKRSASILLCVEQQDKLPRPLPL